MLGSQALRTQRTFLLLHTRDLVRLRFRGAALGLAWNILQPALFLVMLGLVFAVVNRSRAPHTVRCTPDPGGNGDNSRLVPGETQLLAIDKPGRYVCASVQHPRATVVITVRNR